MKPTAILAAILFVCPLVAQAATSRLLRAADADGDGAVTTAEWRAFADALPAVEGQLDKNALRAALIRADLDQDADGEVQRDDLDAIRAALGVDDSGAVSVPAPGGRGGGARGGGGRASLVAQLLMRRADSNDDGTVDADEWRAFAENAGSPIAVATIAGWIADELADVSSSELTAITPGVTFLGWESQLDADRNGKLDAEDLGAVFARVDTNSDGAIDTAELAAANRSGRGRFAGRRIGTAERATRAPGAEPLMPWQRTLDDALALVATTGKPLLIAANSDGEPASENLARRIYRDPEFAEFASGFICVIASNDRRPGRSHDDRGQRLPTERYGRVTNDEHMAIEPLVFARYFGGQRVAPRHVGVAPDGTILFDIFLANDLSVIDAALRKHGKPGVAIPDASELTEAELIGSPDAGHRDALERRYFDSDAETRLRLAAVAMSADRTTQHPEIVRMALLDDDAHVRIAAARGLAQLGGKETYQLFAHAFRAAGDDREMRGDLLEALGRIEAVLRHDETMSEQGRDAWVASVVRMRRLQSALLAESEILDVDAWCAAYEPSLELDPLASELEALDGELDALEAERREKPEDRDIALRMAALRMRYARALIAAGNEPTFFLEDVRAAARRATSDDRPDGRALGYLAWASHLLNEPDVALGYAEQALPHLVEDSGSNLACNVLTTLLQGRLRQLYAELERGEEFPSGRVADVNAAGELLVPYIAVSPGTLCSWLDWLDVSGAWHLEGPAVERIVARFPASADVHQRYRGQLLRDVGARALRAAYARLDSSGEAAVDWFRGYAYLMAAERDVQNRAAPTALASYRDSVASFAACVAANPEWADSANHFACLAEAGRARLLTEAGELEAAAAAMRRAVAVRAGSYESQDGLGNTPRDTFRRLLRQLRAADRDDLAAELDEFVGSAIGGR